MPRPETQWEYRSGIECEDCGKPFECRSCRLLAGRRRLTGPDWPDPEVCPQPEHDTAARVRGWTVWREQGGQQRQTILCPRHRKQRGIPARVVPLEDTA